MPTGKATRIISRFPAFYSAENPNNLLPQLVELFGQILDSTEADLIHVLRSHYVDTADNIGSQGLFGREKGDLDRIFALYLETLGGTSRLTQVNQTFQSTDIRQLAPFVEELVAAQSPLTQNIWAKFSPSTQELLQCYTLAKTQFSPNSPNFSRSLIIRFIAAQDALTRYLRSQFSLTTQQALDHYDGTEPIPIALSQALATDLDRLLRQPTLKHKFAEREIQLQFALSIQPLVPTPPNPATDPQIRQTAAISQHLRQRLSLVAQRLLSPLPRVPLEPEQLRAALAEELPILCKQPHLCQQFLTTLTDPPAIAAVNEAFPIAPAAIAILLSSTLETLETLLLGPVMGDRAITDRLQRPPLPAEAQRLLAQGAIGDDLARLNRLLLEAAYPDLPDSQIPDRSTVQASLVAALNDSILPNAGFDAQNQSSWAALSLPVEAQRLRTAAQTASEPAQRQNLLKRLNRLLLETAYPNYLEKSYAPYRERLRHLIAVLKNGASTKEGIVDIAAANLGIRTDGLDDRVKPWEEKLFDLPLTLESALLGLTVSPTLRQAFLDRGIGISYRASVAMEKINYRWSITDINSAQVYVIYREPDGLKVYRSLIRVIEFLPEAKILEDTIHPQPKLLDPATTLPFRTDFTVNNPNALGMTPAIQVRIRDARDNRQSRLSPLIGLTLTNATTQRSIQYLGSLKCDEVILFLPDGMVLINGVTVAHPQAVLKGGVPELPIGNSIWTITARTGSALATLETTLFDFCRFDDSQEEELDQARSSSYQLDVKVMFDILTPGSFMVKIPWDIPGYTNQFNETVDHPRHQISGLLEKVKAAGVQSVVTYEKQFEETQEMMETLTVRRSPFSEVHDIADRDLVIRSQQKPYGQKPYGWIEHEMTDTLVRSALFDYTYFDSLNTFA
jgi:hypothetical protein